MITPQELRINNLIYIPDTDQILPITAINMDLGVWVNRLLGVLGFDQISPHRAYRRVAAEVWV